MQIYGILLNIRGILLNIRGKSGNFRGKYAENQGIFKEFIPQPLAGCPVLAVVFSRFRSFMRSFLEKIGEFRRKMENIGEIFPFSFYFITLSFLFIPQTLDFIPQMLNLTRYNKKVIFLFGRT